MESLQGGKNILGTLNTEYIQTEAKKKKVQEEVLSYTTTKNLQNTHSFKLMNQFIKLNWKLYTRHANTWMTTMLQLSQNMLKS